MSKIFEFINLHNGKEDKGKVLDNVTANISFRGSNLWILACAILIASVGLNVNSTAVIIGAMLISPLMDPILVRALRWELTISGTKKIDKEPADCYRCKLDRVSTLFLHKSFQGCTVGTAGTDFTKHLRCADRFFWRACRGYSHHTGGKRKPYSRGCYSHRTYAAAMHRGIRTSYFKHELFFRCILPLYNKLFLYMHCYIFCY